jgi:hypothetical protein
LAIENIGQFVRAGESLEEAMEGELDAHLEDEKSNRLYPPITTPGVLVVDVLLSLFWSYVSVVFILAYFTMRLQ